MSSIGPAGLEELNDQLLQKKASYHVLRTDDGEDLRINMIDILGTLPRLASHFGDARAYQSPWDAKTMKSLLKSLHSGDFALGEHDEYGCLDDGPQSDNTNLDRALAQYMKKLRTHKRYFVVNYGYPHYSVSDFAKKKVDIAAFIRFARLYCAALHYRLYELAVAASRSLEQAIADRPWDSDVVEAVLDSRPDAENPDLRAFQLAGLLGAVNAAAVTAAAKEAAKEVAREAEKAGTAKGKGKGRGKGKGWSQPEDQAAKAARVAEWKAAFAAREAEVMKDLGAIP